MYDKPQKARSHTLHQSDRVCRTICSKGNLVRESESWGVSPIMCFTTRGRGGCRPDPVVHIRVEERPVLTEAAAWADRSRRAASRPFIATRGQDRPARK